MVGKGFSIRKAAFVYGIAVSTLHSRLTKPPVHNHPGKPTILSAKDENRIIDFIDRCCKVGLPIDIKRLRISVGQYMKLSGRTNAFPNGMPGRKWVNLFLKRHPEVSRRVPSALSKQRTNVTEESIRKWFAEISTYIYVERLQNTLRNPASVFNLDETGIRLVPTKESVLAKCGERYVHTSNANSEKENYTVLFCASAAGILAPPLILFPYKLRLPAEIVRSMPDGWAAGKSDSGWMTQETFYYYLRNVFHPWLVQSQTSFPVIVFLDGHSSHVCYQTIEFCREKDIVLICLYPNSTHVLQPLDVSFFRGLKVRWNRELIDWRIKRAGEPLTRTEFAPLLKQAIGGMENLANTLQNGFRKCGIVPFDPDAVNYGMLLQNTGNERESNPSVASTFHAKVDIDRSRVALEVIESFLTSNQRQTFIENEKAVTWVGSTSDINLFHMWKHIKKIAGKKPMPPLETEFHGFDESEITGELPETHFVRTNEYLSAFIFYICRSKKSCSHTYPIYQGTGKARHYL